jgi:hypothetical protein
MFSTLIDTEVVNCATGAENFEANHNSVHIRIPSAYMTPTSRYNARLQ